MSEFADRDDEQDEIEAKPKRKPKRKPKSAQGLQWWIPNIALPLSLLLTILAALVMSREPQPQPPVPTLGSTPFYDPLANLPPLISTAQPGFSPTMIAEQINGLAWSPDGRALLVASSFRGGESTLRLYNPDALYQPPLVVPKAPGTLTLPTFSPDSTLLAAALSVYPEAGEQHQVVLWSVRALQQANGDTSIDMQPAMTFEAQPALITSVIFNADGSRLAVGSSDGRVRLYDPRLHIELVAPQAAYSTQGVTDLRYLPDGTLATQLADRLDANIPAQVVVWRTPETSATFVTLPGLLDANFAAALSSSSEITPAAQDALLAWAAEYRGVRQRVSDGSFERADALTASAFSQDDTRMAVLVERYWEGYPTSGGEVAVWQASTIISRYAHPSSPVAALAFRPDGGLLALGTADGEVIILDASDGSIEASLRI
jgi:WD40 repeat protein